VYHVAYGLHFEKGILHTIDAALGLEMTLSPILSEDERFKSLLESLRQSIKATHKEMVAVGMVNECADCAAIGEGTCCTTRTHLKYDKILLLINLLLGAILPHRAALPGTCHFLAEQGCMLTARHVICVNFLCRRLREKIEHWKLVRVQEVAGEELTTLFMLEEYLKKRIRLLDG
jgi:hypothetical protein